jgi:oxygen-independent coproporphyrinogen-3 oxidase
VRWCNVRHPTAYAARIGSGVSPAQAREQLTPEQRRDERVLLGIRLAEGLPLAAWPDRSRLAGLVADGLVDGAAAIAGRAALTRRGRLLADTVVHTLLA